MHDQIVLRIPRRPPSPQCPVKSLEKHARTRVEGGDREEKHVPDPDGVGEVRETGEGETVTRPEVAIGSRRASVRGGEQRGKEGRDAPSHCVGKHRRSTPLEHHPVRVRIEMQWPSLIDKIMPLPQRRRLPRVPQDPSDRINDDRVTLCRSETPLHDAGAAGVQRIERVDLCVTRPLNTDNEGRRGRRSSVGGEKRVGEVDDAFVPSADRAKVERVRVGVDPTAGEEE